MTSIKIAVTQAEPEWLDLAGYLVNVKPHAVAAAEDARIIVFPDVWVLGRSCLETACLPCGMSRRTTQAADSTRRALQIDMEL